MLQKFFVVSFSLFLLLPLFPKNTYALAAPAATSCNNTGGNYELIYKGALPTSGVCNYPLGIQCSDYQFYQTSECTGMVLFFGSLHSWPARILFSAVLIFLVYLFAKRFKHPVSGIKN